MPEPQQNADNEPEAEPQHRNHRDPRDPRNHLDANPLIKPFVVLALPGMYLCYKYNQYKRKRKENATRRLAERELVHLNNKIEKLLSKLDESEAELATCQEEECVICINAKATMQTSPCGHQVVCRKCFVKTIQIAVSQRLLPLRCVICRAKILRLKTGPMLPTSVSGYSVSSRSSSVAQSDSLYSVSSGGSSISSNSSASERCQHCFKDPRDPGPSKGCGGQCGLRQPITGAIRRSQKREMKKTLQDYHRPEKNHINRLPPIKEMSPLHAPPASTRIRCAQKIVTQLEMPIFNRNHRGQKYERLPLEDEDIVQPSTSQKCEKPPEKTQQKSKFYGREKSPEIPKNIEKTNTEKYKFLEQKISENKSTKKWWQDSRRSFKSEERIDNKKNEIMEKQMELKEKINNKIDKLKSKEKSKLLLVDDESL